MEACVVQHSKQRRGVLVKVRSMELTLHTVQTAIVSEGAGVTVDGRWPVSSRD